ncbi:hypothetical protein W02_32970 [Nitrospira sp. KM1]|uniref:response regulator n=1 Tax=Nitrospira sp. KM1 TaxID=1936990 RepID=UPI0013A734D8|nr:response regulator transcription factor [Nitrospira sp. KM1]BCA56157.1 hypothetical protein W02_32970 [Nitrospira sp. KM1]
MSRLRVLLADDHSSIRMMLQSLLEPEYDVVASAANGRAAIEAAQALRPDIVLTDIDIPVVNGIEAAREIHRSLPECRLIFYSSYSEPEIMSKAFAAGASGYLIKGSSHSLLSSIRAVVQHVWCNQDHQSCPIDRTALDTSMA